MQDGLSICCREAKITRYRDPEAACYALPDLMPCRAPGRLVVMSSFSIARNDSSGLSALALALGAQMVTLQDSAGAQNVAARGWRVLPSPFTSADLRGLCDALFLSTAGTGADAPCPVGMARE